MPVRLRCSAVLFFHRFIIVKAPIRSHFFCMLYNVLDLFADQVRVFDTEKTVLGEKAEDVCESGFFSENRFLKIIDRFWTANLSC